MKEKEMTEVNDKWRKGVTKRHNNIFMRYGCKKERVCKYRDREKRRKRTE